MLLKIDFESEMPIYEQLRRQIIIGIATGELELGEELPSVRQLGGDIGINLHTVNKTYNILKNEGYLIIDRRKGAMIKDRLPEVNDDYMNILENELDYLIADSKNRGIKKDEFLKLCSGFYDKLKDKEDR
ncbi:GntR family transcriptional regulator [Tissierella carlieri]|jgi:GntR family transcriptional regulator|uniref:GntR family transcriptional regulator n=1 Tax=Tissierella carlieri TaxID=689904 RepID=A0ABT1SB23_9FIRM|nr:GntR family transcriptional regulator [Tissierella carlieri]MBU5312269.1 GntR family transcriptional regulator [Tissierella carlieri]MCQ4923682.1 GntR family transcriptional regulator [Tissierella carlieri]